MNLDIKFYWKLLLRRLPVMALLFMLLAALGVAAAIKLPTSYNSTAVLLVESPQIPKDLAESTVQTNAVEEITLIRDQLLIRSTLLDIANKYTVFPDLRDMRTEDVVAGMRAATRIDYRGGRGSPIRLTIGFDSHSGQIAAAVVNEYTTRLLAASVRQRTDRAGDTLKFFVQEVERLDGELAERSAALSEFQSENSASLPSSLNYRLGRQELLLERVADANRERSGLVEQRARIVSIFEATGQVDTGAPGSRNRNPAAQEVEKLRADLTKALAVFSESHPRIQTLRNRIAQAEKVLADQSGAQEADETSTPQALFDLQMGEIDQRIETLDAQIARNEAELKTLEATLDSTPSNAIKLATMQRDYDAIRQQYDQAVRSLAEARLGERIELTARGQRITLIEPGIVPNEPSSPNRQKIAAMGIGAGGALAIGYFLLLELLNKSIRRPAEIVGRLGITPIGTIPFIETAKQRRMRRMARVLVSLAVIIGVPMALWAVDSYYLPLDLLLTDFLDRFGLT